MFEPAEPEFLKPGPKDRAATPGKISSPPAILKVGLASDKEARDFLEIII